MDVLSVMPVGYTPEAPAGAPAPDHDRRAERPSEFDTLVSEAEDAPEDVRGPARPRRDRPEPRDRAEPEVASSAEPPAKDAKDAPNPSDSESGRTSAEKPATFEETAAAPATQATADGPAPTSGAALSSLLLPTAGAQSAAPTALAANPAAAGAQAQAAPQDSAPTLAAPSPVTISAAPIVPAQMQGAHDASAAQPPAPVASPDAAQAPVATPVAPGAPAATTAPAVAPAAAALAAPASEVPVQNLRADRDVAKTAKTSDGKNAARSTAADPAASAGKPAAPGADAATVKTAATAERPIVSVQDQAQPADAANTAGRAAGQTIDATDAGGLRRTETAHAAQAPERASPHRGPAIDLAALATRFAARVQNGATQFSIRLDPAELGRVDVQLEVGGDGVAHARLIAERPEALAELTRNARALERELADAGVDLSRGGISFELAGREGGEARERGDSFAESRPAFVNTEDAEPLAQAADAFAEIDTAYGFSVLRRGRLDVRI